MSSSRDIFEGNLAHQFRQTMITFEMADACQPTCGLPIKDFVRTAEMVAKAEAHDVRRKQIEALNRHHKALSKHVARLERGNRPRPKSAGVRRSKEGSFSAWRQQSDSTTSNKARPKSARPAGGNVPSSGVAGPQDQFKIDNRRMQSDLQVRSNACTPQP